MHPTPFRLLFNKSTSRKQFLNNNVIVFVLKQDRLMLSSGEDYIMSEMNAIRYLLFVYMIIFGFNNKHLYTLITFRLFWGYY